MTSTSSEPVVLRDLPAGAVDSSGAGADLRSGTWTRLGGSAVLGDAVTEVTLAALAESTRDAARAQGYAAGWAQGRRAYLEAAEAAEAERGVRQAADRARAAAERDAATAALGRAVAGSQARVEQAWAELADQAVTLAVRIAEAILAREVATSPDAGADALRRALTEVPALVPVTVRMHPADRAALDLDVLEGRPVGFVDDPALARGDAVVETEHGVVDATVAAALERVREVLAR